MLFKIKACYINFACLELLFGTRLFSIIAILSYFLKSNLKIVFFFSKSWKITQRIKKPKGTVDKSFRVLSLEVNIFNYVFHLQRGIV